MLKSPSVSTRSKFEDDKPEEIFHEEYLRYEDVEPSREREPNKRFHYEGYRDEKIRQLSKRRSGHIGLLTRIFNEIPNDKIMAERRLCSLKNRLAKDTELFIKYTKAMQITSTKDMPRKYPRKN
jgi:hypothetical protein